MPAFSKMGVFPAGYFRASSAWLLRERRDVAARVETIGAELKRIGFVKVIYAQEPEGASTKRTEVRVGFSVSRDSSLGRLVQAYIATGGNPFDISGFLHPDTTEVIDTENGHTKQKYPKGGVHAPKSVEYNNPLPQVTTDDGTGETHKSGYEGYEGGYLETDRYYPARQGGRIDRGAWDSDTIVRTMHETRSWNNQAIKFRLQDIEWQIIKLSDLHEQLTFERDETLTQAFGGLLDGGPDFDEDRFDPQMLVPNLVQDMYRLLYKTDDFGIVAGFETNPDVGFLVFTFQDVPSDKAGDLG